jgi:hypothetical protein
VTFCPDLISYNGRFDYNRIVNALESHDLTIDQVTTRQFVIQLTISLEKWLTRLCFRLQYMQAVALVTGDEFLVPYNLTIDTGNLEYILYELSWSWFENQYQIISFDDIYGVHFYQNHGLFGTCYIFNIIAYDKIFNQEM